MTSIAPTFSTMAQDPVRAQMWVDCGERWFDNADPFILLNIQMLGHAEPPLLTLEAELARLACGQGPSIRQGMLLMQCSALSIYWIFGLYEVLRTLKECAPTRFAPLDGLFHTVGVVRMPLAKHEVKSAPDYRRKAHYPTSVWDPATGRIGWYAFDPQRETMITVTRTDVADRFLTTQASSE
jgi:hypothetical protein